MTKANKVKIGVTIISLLLIVLLVVSLFSIITKEESEIANAAIVPLAVSANTDGAIPTIEGITPEEELMDSGKIRYHFTDKQITNELVKSAIPALKGKKAVFVKDDERILSALKNSTEDECIVLLNNVKIDWRSSSVKSSSTVLKANFFGNGYTVNINAVGGSGNFDENLRTATNSKYFATPGVSASGVGEIRPTGMFVAVVNPGVIISTTEFNYTSNMSTLDYIDKTPTMLYHEAKHGMAAAGIITGFNYGVIGNCVLNINSPFTFMSDGLSSGLGWEEIKENCAITGGIAAITAYGGNITRTTVNMAPRGEINSLARGKENNWEAGRSACSMAGAFVGNFVPTYREIPNTGEPPQKVHTVMSQCTLNGSGLVQSLVGYATNQGSYQAYAGALMGGACYFKDDGKKIYAVEDYDIGQYGSSISGIMSSYTGRIKHNYNIVFDKNYANVDTDYGKLFGKMGSSNGLSKMIVLYDYREFCKANNVSGKRLTTVGKGEFQKTDITIDEIGTLIYPTNAKGTVEVKHVYDVPNRDIEVKAIAEGNSISDEDYKKMGNSVKKKFPINHDKGNLKLGGIIWEANLKGSKDINPFSTVEGGNEYIGSYIYRFNDLASAVGDYKFTFGEIVDYSFDENEVKNYDGNGVNRPNLKLSSILNKSYETNGKDLSNVSYSWFINDKLATDLTLQTNLPGTYRFEPKARADLGGSTYKDVAYYDEANNLLAYPNSKVYLATVNKLNLDVKNSDETTILSNVWKKSLDFTITPGIDVSNYTSIKVIKNGIETKEGITEVGKKYSYKDIQSSAQKTGDQFKFVLYKVVDTKEYIVAESKEFNNICIDHTIPEIRSQSFYEIMPNGDEVYIQDINAIEYTKHNIRATFEVTDSLSGIKYSNLNEIEDYEVKHDDGGDYFAVNIILTGDNGVFTFMDGCGNILPFDISVKIDNVSPTIEVNGILGANIRQGEVFSQPYRFNANLDIGKSGYDIYMATYFDPDTNESTNTSLNQTTNEETIKNLPELAWTLFAENVKPGSNELFVREEVTKKEIWFKLVNKQLGADQKPLHEPVFVQLKHIENATPYTLFTIDLRFGNLYISLENIFIKDKNISLAAAGDDVKKTLFTVEYADKLEYNLSDKLEVRIKEYKNNTRESYIGAGAININSGSDFYDVNTQLGLQVWATYNASNASTTANDKTVSISIRYNPNLVSTLNTTKSTETKDVIEDLDYGMRFPVYLLKNDEKVKNYVNDERITQALDSKINGTLGKKLPVECLQEGNKYDLGQIGSIIKADREVIEFNQIFDNKEFVFGDDFPRKLQIELSDGTPIHFDIIIKQSNGTLIKDTDTNLSADTYEITLSQLDSNDNYNIRWETKNVVLNKKEVYANPLFIPNGDETKATEDVPMTIQYNGKSHQFGAYIIDNNLINRQIDVTYTLNGKIVESIKDVGEYIVTYVINYDSADNEDLINYKLVFDEYYIKVTTAILKMDKKTVEKEYTGSVIPYQYNILDIDSKLADDIIKSGNISTQFYKYNDNAVYDPTKKEMSDTSTYSGTPITQVKDVGYYRVEIIFKGYNDNFIAQNYYDLLVINKAESKINVLDITVPYDGNKHGFDISKTYANIMGKNTKVKIVGIPNEKFPTTSSYNAPEWTKEDDLEGLKQMITMEYKDPMTNLYKPYDDNKNEGKFMEIGDYSYQLTYAENNNYLKSNIIVKLHIVNAYMEDITISGSTCEYDGKEHTIVISNVPEGAIIEYLLYKDGKIDKRSKTPITQINAGNYIMSAIVSKENYNDFILDQVVLEITEATLTGIKANGAATTYDGKTHGVVLEGLTKEEGKDVYFFNDPLRENAKVIANVVDKDNALVGFVNASNYNGVIKVKVVNYKELDVPYTLIISQAKARVNYDNINDQLNGQDYSKFDFSTLKATYETNGTNVECDVYIMKVEGEDEVLAQLNEDGTLAPGTYRIYASADQNYVVRDYAVIEIADTSADNASSGMNQKTIIIIASSVGGGVVLIGIIVGIVIAVKKKKSASF